MARQLLCEIDVLPGELAAREVELLPPGEGVRELSRIFVVKHGACHYAYVNSCPHVGAPLNWQKDQFFSHDERHLQCSLHGALFSIENGICVHGPCVGAGLQPLKVEVTENKVYVFTE